MRLYDGSGSQHVALPHLISVSIKLRLYNSCILPTIFLYGAEIWAVTGTAAKTFDALDQWCLRCILNIHWTERITNNEVRSRTQQPLLSDAVSSRRLRFFGHICRADPSQDHSRALYASTTGLPKHWRRRPGQPRQTWLRTIENDLRPLNLHGSGDSSTACSEQNSLADTRGNGYVADKLWMMTMNATNRNSYLNIICIKLRTQVKEKL